MKGGLKISMKTTLTLTVLSLLVVSLLPGVYAQVVGGGITPDITTEEFAPLVFMCGSRIVVDDNVYPGRFGAGGSGLFERINNYAFEGEQIQLQVLVMDKNGAQKISDVYVTVGSSQGAGNDIEANCVRTTGPQEIPAECNARILQEHITVFDPQWMDYYSCTFTVETPFSMHGEYWVTVEAEDLSGLQGTMAENEYWFLNPEIALSIEGFLSFEDVRPGTDSYSNTLLVGNDAEHGSGVILDMFISGTDFYDSSSSGAACPNTNQLSLGAFRYFATSGAYSTLGDSRRDAEGYVGINYGASFGNFGNNNPFYGTHEIIQNAGLPANFYHPGNLLTPGAEQALTFKLSLPEPCNGNFDTGAIYFWGEAI